jgi:hypothetical protein
LPTGVVEAKISEDMKQPFTRVRSLPLAAAAFIALNALMSCPTATGQVSRLSPILGTPVTIDVRTAGAAGDGSADDSAVIERALASLWRAGGGELIFPPGTYRIGRAIVVNGQANFTIRGSRATLVADPRMPITGAGMMLSFANCSNFEVCGLALDANSGKRGLRDAAVTIRLNGCKQFKLRDLQLSNAVGDHIYLQANNAADDRTACADGLIEGCTLTNAGRNAISVIHAKRVSIIGNTLRAVGTVEPRTGIDVESNANDSPGANSDLLIERNDIAEFPIGLSIRGTRGPTRIRVADNTIHDCGYGVICEGTACTIAGNTLASLSNIGIGLSIAENEAVDNLLVGGKSIGIYADGTNQTIRNNRIIDCGDVTKGCCIDAYYTKGGVIIDGNRIIKHEPNSSWEAIRTNGKEPIGRNYRQGVKGLDGGF